MPFGLTNVPSVFQRFMNHVLSDLIDKGVVIYIDNILIYTETEEEHTKLVTKVLELLRDAGLCISLDKSVFHAQRVEFLGYVIGVDGVMMSEESVKQIKEWEAPRNLKEVQSFLGFANFYRRFMESYSKICVPLTDLTKKGVPWMWLPSYQQAFDDLKERFLPAPILAHFHHQH